MGIFAQGASAVKAGLAPEEFRRNVSAPVALAYGPGSDGMDSKMFHQRARDCLRLADECPDLYAREALVELADDFKQMAKLLETDSRPRTRRQRTASDDANDRQPAAR